MFVRSRTPQIGMTVGWHELTGARSSKELLRERLAPFGLQPLLLGLSRLSAQLNTWQKRNNPRGALEAVRQMLPRFYPPIKQLLATDPNRVILSRVNILYVAKQVMLTCDLVGKQVETNGDDEQVMVCCLMANDLILGLIPSSTDTTIDKATGLLPLNDYLPDPDDPIQVARNLFLINEIAPRLTNRRDYRDLAELFERGTNLTPQTFCEFVVGCATKFVTNLPAQNDASGLILTRDYFRHTKIEGDLTNFLHCYGVRMIDLQAVVRSDNSHDCDFRNFQDRPLIEFQPDHFLCIDAGFLFDKAGRSFYWTLHANTPDTKRSDLLSYWGSVVERYAQWLTQTTYQGKGEIIPNALFANGDQACDLMIKEGSRLILIEIKANLLTADAKYSFDANFLQKELLKKAIEGDGKKRKGLKQLHNTIDRFSNGESVAGIMRDQISIVYPVILFLDRSFVSPYLPALYREHFDRKALPRKPVTTEPYTLTLSDLESVLPYTCHHDLSDIIDDYYKHHRSFDPGLNFGRFRYSQVPLLKNLKPGNDLVGERFSRFFNELIGNLFPTGLPQ